MASRLSIALIAHDARKSELADWAEAHLQQLESCALTDVLVFFIDPLSALPHDVDVKALVRLAVLSNIRVALSRSTADIILATLLPASPQ